MPDRKEIFIKGGYFHIFNRTSHSQILFHSPENYRYCLRLVFKNAARFKISVLAFCLMPNHYHFLMRPDGAGDGLSKCMGYAFNSYTQAFNKENKTHGPLLQDRFKAVGIDRVDLLIYVCRYIHLNPVKAGLVKMPEEWPYSDYAEWISMNEGNGKKTGLVGRYFKDGKAYGDFVHDPSMDNQESQFIRYILE